MVVRPRIESKQCRAILAVDIQVFFDPVNDKQLFVFHRTTCEQVRDHRETWSSFITSFGVMESAKIPSPIARIALVLSTLGCSIVYVNVEALDLVTKVIGDGHECRGRVEINHAGQWVTVCNRGWDMSDTRTVCREVGCWLASLPSGFKFSPSRAVWLNHVSCTGEVPDLTHCSHSNRNCSILEEAMMDCSGKPVLSILSPFTAFQVGEAIHFSCTAPSGPKFLNFHLYKKGVETPLVTQRADNGQRRMELTLTDVEVAHQGTYSCVNSDRRSSHPPKRMYHSNYIDIAVVELNRPQIWYNTSMEAPSGWVFKGESFSVTCSTHPLYPGGSFQLRLIRPNGTVRHSLPALAPAVTFTFSNAHTQNEGYYCCQYRVQMGKRMLASRESQPLPISVRADTDLAMSPVMISLLVSGLTFVVATFIILIVFRILSKRKRKLTELERESRTCVDNTYIALTTIK
ncbi:uncharacterized protein si:ch211-150o23.3 isoform X1 [Sardina pilchardus]|uniref:uncharacterized protein si:ch211-150o23.3 isoform X1 n=1 Tax=Sardina pilchardus TaxID=27697 RepID=UPI002E122E0D